MSLDLLSVSVERRTIVLFLTEEKQAKKMGASSSILVTFSYHLTSN